MGRRAFTPWLKHEAVNLVRERQWVVAEIEALRGKLVRVQ